MKGKKQKEGKGFFKEEGVRGEIRFLLKFFMLSKKQRIKKKKDFEEVFKKGNFFSSNFFGVKIKENNLSFSRFGFVFPVKQEKRAVKRNKGKRMFREVLKKESPSIKGGFDIIFIIKKESLKAKREDIEKEVKNIIEKAKII